MSLVKQKKMLLVFFTSFFYEIYIPVYANQIELNNEQCFFRL